MAKGCGRTAGRSFRGVASGIQTAELAGMLLLCAAPRRTLADRRSSDAGAGPGAASQPMGGKEAKKDGPKCLQIVTSCIHFGS